MQNRYITLSKQINNVELQNHTKYKYLKQDERIYNPQYQYNNGNRYYNGDKSVGMAYQPSNTINQQQMLISPIVDCNENSNIYRYNTISPFPSSIESIKSSNPSIQSIPPPSIEDDENPPPPPPIVYVDEMHKNTNNNNIYNKSIMQESNKNNNYRIKVDNIDGMESMVKDIFEIVGNLISITVKDMPIKYAIIEYGCEKSANNAICKFNGKKNNAKDLNLSVYRINDYDNPNKIFIYNVSKSLTEEKLKTILSTVGDIKSLYIDRSDDIKDETTTAEVEFYDRKTTEEAKDFLEGTFIENIPIQVCISKIINNGIRSNGMKTCGNIKSDKNPHNHDNLNTIFVGCLSEAVCEDDLRKEFEKIGEIHSVRIFRQKSRNECPDYAYVNYVNPESMLKAVKELNGIDINGRFITVQFSKKKSNKKFRTA